MFKRNKTNKTKGIAAATCAIMLMGSLAGSSYTVMAATEGVTPVTYDNSIIIDVDNNGKWGVAIPGSVGFTDTKMTVTSDVELVGIDGTDLDATYSKVEVTGKVSSAKGYKLEGSTGSTAATYEMIIDGKKFEINDHEQEFAKKFGLGTATGGLALNKKLNLTARLTKKGDVKGQYKDTLLFNFAGVATAKSP